MSDALGIGGLLLVGATLFVRFLLVGLRTRDTATLLIAFATLVGIAALSLLALAVQSLAGDPERSRWLAAGAVASATLCVSSNVAMTAIEFRRGSRIGWLASGVFMAAMWASVVGIFAQGGVDLRRPPSTRLLVNSVLLLGTLFWGSLEAAVTWRFLHRRAQMGLASTRLVNRVAFWSLASGVTAIGGTIAIATLAFGVSLRGRNAFLILGGLGLLAAAALWRSFGLAERVERSQR